jgi:HEAT repeat protein
LDDRLQAIVVAGHAGDEATAREALTDPSAAIRVAALGALDRMRMLTTDDLRSALEDPDSSVVIRAAELAIGLADVDLVAHTTRRDARIVETVAWSLGERGPDQPQADAAVRALVGLTSHSDALVREAAVAALGAIGDPAGLPAILTATSDKPAVRRRAVVALAAFDGPEVDAALQRATQDRDWQVRQVAEDLSPPNSRE